MKQAEMTLTGSSSENTPFPADARVINGSARQLWHKSAPEAVRRAFTSGDHLSGFGAWRAYPLYHQVIRPSGPLERVPRAGGIVRIAVLTRPFLSAG